MKKIDRKIIIKHVTEILEKCDMLDFEIQETIEILENAPVERVLYYLIGLMDGEAIRKRKNE